MSSANRNWTRVVALLTVLTFWISGCGKEDMPVVQLNYLETDWTILNPSGLNGEADDSVKVSSILEACTGPEEELSGDLTVYDTFVAYRRSMTAFGERDTFKSVSYFKGDHNYVICQNEASVSPVVRVVDEFPEFVDVTAGVPVNTIPTIEHSSDKVEGYEPVDQLGNPIRIIEGSTFQLKPGILGEIELKLGAKTMLRPFIVFDPMSARYMKNVRFSIGYSDSTELAYIVLSFGEGHYSSKLLHFFDETQSNPYETTFVSLDVKPIADDEILKSDTPVRVYTFTYIEDGEQVSEDLSFTFYPTTDGDHDSRLSDAHERENQQADIYLHKMPYDGETPLNYPDAVRAAGIDFDDLLDAIKTARPVKRPGDTGVYRYLTINQGLKGQVFEVSYKQRSKKLDIYLTDAKRELTFKLTSEGAETFLSYFPELKKD